MRFDNYKTEYHDMVIDFLVNINQEKKNHLNWIWARFEWMVEHSYCRKDLLQKMGLWFDKDSVVGAALFDMYLGEAFVGALEEYKHLYKEILEFAYNNLKDDSGLGVSIYDNDKFATDIALSLGFFKQDKGETIMSLSLDNKLPIDLDKEISFIEIDPVKDAYELQWLFWQGFDHGDNKEQFEKEEKIVPQIRKHFNPYLTVTAVNEKHEMVGLAGAWYEPRTKYAYLEPVCVIPPYRKKGIAKAMIYEVANKAAVLGAKKLYVLTDFVFYEKLGFKVEEHYTFYHKKNIIEVNNVPYEINRLLGKGKGGYSYLTKRDGKSYVVKQIHHEPCDYYNFGNKIEAELNDYKRLSQTGIKMPLLIDIDIKNERIVKEYIDGPTISEEIENGNDVSKYIPQITHMAKLARDNGLNIDYYPTNFVVMNDVLYYIDYECNEYMDEWSFENWGQKYWNKR